MRFSLPPIKCSAGDSSQLPTTAEHCFVDSTVVSDLIIARPAVVESWDEPPNIWLMVAKNAFVGWSIEQSRNFGCSCVFWQLVCENQSTFGHNMNRLSYSCGLLIAFLQILWAIIRWKNFPGIIFSSHWNFTGRLTSEVIMGKIACLVDLSLLGRILHVLHFKHCRLHCKQFVAYPNQATSLSLPSNTNVSILFEINTFSGSSKKSSWKCLSNLRCLNSRVLCDFRAKTYPNCAFSDKYD